MKQITLQIHDKFADILIIGAVGHEHGRVAENTTTCTIHLGEKNQYTIGADGVLRPYGDNCEEVPR